jgi:hypothetical protein
MSNRERIVIYAALALLAAMNIAVLADGRGGSAWAQGPAELTHLGPAGSLTLAGDKDEPLVLRNANGRLSWSDTDYARSFSVAFAHVGQAMGPLLEADEYVDEYQELEAEFLERDKEVAEAIDAFRQEHQDITPDDPEMAQVHQTLQAMLQQREQMRVVAARRLGQLASDHIELAYRDLVAAVEVVADRRNIDIVYRFIPTGNDFNAANPPQSYTGVRARIVLKYPEKLDITDEVMEELALEVQ